MRTKSIFRRAIIMLACVGFAFFASAQFSFAPRIAVGAGLMKYTYSDPDNPGWTVDNKPGVSLGLGCEARYRLAKAFSIHSGIFYQMIKSKIEWKNEEETETWDQTANYINIPIEAVYGAEEGFYGGIGINVGIGLSGKSEWDYHYSFLGTDYSESGKSDIKFDGKKQEELPDDDDNHHLTQINPGLSVKAGWSFGKMCVGVNAELGFSDLDPNANQKATISSVCAHFAYVFGGGSKEKN